MKKAIIGIIVAAALLIIAAIVYYPGLQNYYLRQGIEYARDKTMATMPAIDGYNPDIHTHDPLIMSESFRAVREMLDIDALSDDTLMHNISGFMDVFRGVYNDQSLVPADRDKIAAAMESLQAGFAERHFSELRKQIFKTFVAHKVEKSRQYDQILVYDSIALFNPGIKTGINAPLTAHLINTYYRANADGEIDSADVQTLKTAIIKIEQYQTYDELKAVLSRIYKSDQFKEFGKKEDFRESASKILAHLRKMDFDFLPIKATLRSAVLVWNEQQLSENPEPYDLETIYQFLRYAADAIEMQKQTD